MKQVKLRLFVSKEDKTLISGKMPSLRDYQFKFATIAFWVYTVYKSSKLNLGYLFGDLEELENMTYRWAVDALRTRASSRARCTRWSEMNNNQLIQLCNH